VGFLRDTLFGRSLARDALDEPLEGTTQTLWPAVSAFLAENLGGSGLYISPSMAEKVWVANRCIQLNAQQIGAMPVEYHTTAPAGGFEPAWVSSPDPVWFPNGIGDVLFAIVENIYGWGYAVLQITSRYASGFASGFTVLDPRALTIDIANGRRTYKYGDRYLDPRDIVQIDRNPGNRLHGTSAIASYASQAWGILAGGEQSRSVLSGGIPQTVLKPKRKIDSAQAEALQSQWATAAARRNGAPAVLPPEVDFDVLSFNPKDLALLEAQEFTVRAVASAYGVPAAQLNMAVTGGLTYQNPAMLGEQWWRFELRTTTKRVEDAFSAQLLPRGSWVTVDASDTFAPITEVDDENDPQESRVAGASPTQLDVVTPIRQGGARA
jgi:HK97 family phage portal protein